MASTGHRQLVEGPLFEDRLSVGRFSSNGAGLAALRAELVQRCHREDSSDRAVREAVDAAVGRLANAGPLVDTGAVQSVSDQDLVWCTQSVQ